MRLFNQKFKDYKKETPCFPNQPNVISSSAFPDQQNLTYLKPEIRHFSAAMLKAFPIQLCRFEHRRHEFCGANFLGFRRLGCTAAGQVCRRNHEHITYWLSNWKKMLEWTFPVLTIEI